MSGRFTLIFILFGIVSLAGCFPDKKESYKAVVDSNGELVPRDPLARNFEKAPDPNSTILIPAKKKTPKEQEKAEEKVVEEEPQDPSKPRPPDAYFGIPTYPNSHYAEGHEGMVVSGTMKQVFLETIDIPEFVDSFYINKLPPESRTETKGAFGKVFLYTLPVMGQEVRTLQISGLKKSTQIIVTSMQDPLNHAFMNSAPPRDANATPERRPAPAVPTPTKPVTKLPAMPQSQTPAPKRGESPPGSP